MLPDPKENINHLAEDFDHFFENSLCGYVIATPEGKITRANKTLAGWLGIRTTELNQKRFSDLLAIGGKIYYETHLWPLLRMQSYFEEVALELDAAGQKKIPVLVNGLEHKNEKGELLFIRFSLFRATDRRTYEQNLKEAKESLEISLANAIEVSELREQLIAILGHDLRNPLGSIIMGASLLSQSSLTAEEAGIINIIRRSSSRMTELINNILDFARTRLGEGILIEPQPTEMEPVLRQVADELRSTWPGRIIHIDFQLPAPVNCDGPRIAQVFSNLLGNAVTHGLKDAPVDVKCLINEGFFEIIVCNAGEPIPGHLLSKLFEPYTRENSRSNKNGLGLGLYIASQISKAHHGEITVTSTPEQTCFIFRMPAY